MTRFQEGEIVVWWSDRGQRLAIALPHSAPHVPSFHLMRTEVENLHKALDCALDDHKALVAVEGWREAAADAIREGRMIDAIQLVIGNDKTAWPFISSLDAIHDATKKLFRALITEQQGRGVSVNSSHYNAIRDAMVAHAKKYPFGAAVTELEFAGDYDPPPPRAYDSPSARAERRARTRRLIAEGRCPSCMELGECLPQCPNAGSPRTLEEYALPYDEDLP